MRQRSSSVSSSDAFAVFHEPLFLGKMAACPSSGKVEQQRGARRFVFIASLARSVVERRQLSPLQKYKNHPGVKILIRQCSAGAVTLNARCLALPGFRWNSWFLTVSGWIAFSGAVGALRRRFHCRLGRAAVPPSAVAAPCYTPLLPLPSSDEDENELCRTVCLN